MEAELDISFVESEISKLAENFIGNGAPDNFSNDDFFKNLSFLYDKNHTLPILSAGDKAFQKITQAIHVYVLPIIILIGIVGNAVSFLVYVGTPRLCRQSTSVYLAFLAVIQNVSLVTVLVVWFGWVGIYLFHKNGWCQTVLYCMYVCSFLSVWTVVSFTCERWIVVFHPLKRHKLCTRERAIIVMTSLTLSALAFYTFSIFTSHVKHAAGGLKVCSQDPSWKSALQIIRSVDTVFTVIIPSMVIMVMNIGIGLKTWNYTKRQHTTRPLSTSVNDDVFSHFSSERHSETSRQGQGLTSTLSMASQSRVVAMTINDGMSRNQWRFFTRRQQTQLRITKALLVVSSVFVILNLPNFAFRIHAFVITIRQESYTMSFQAFIWQEFIQFLHFINQSSNFFLYYLCSRNFRFAVKRLLRRIKRRLIKTRNTIMELLRCVSND